MISSRRRCMTVIANDNVNPDMGAISNNIDIAYWAGSYYYLPFGYDTYQTEGVYDIPMCKLSDRVNKRFKNVSVLNSSVIVEQISESISGDGGAIYVAHLKEIYFKRYNGELYIYGKVSCTPSLLDINTDFIIPYTDENDWLIYSDDPLWGWKEPILYAEPWGHEYGSCVYNFKNLNIDDSDIGYVADHSYVVNTSTEYISGSPKMYLSYQGDLWEWTVGTLTMKLSSNNNAIVYVTELTLDSVNLRKPTGSPLQGYNSYWNVYKSNDGWYIDIVFNDNYLFSPKGSEPYISYKVCYNVLTK